MSLRLRTDRIIVPGQFRSLLPGAIPYERLDLHPAPEAVVLHKGMLEKLGREWIERATAALQPTFANEVFVVFSKSHLAGSVSESIHFTAYLEKLEFLSSQHETAGVIANKAVDRESIRWACRLLLLREPESENEIQSYLQCPDVWSLQRAFFASPEFRSLQREAAHHGRVVADTDVPCTFFVHIPKTGGTTLHNFLASHYPNDQICPERHNHLTNLTIRELSAFRLFSGHFDWTSIDLFPVRSRRIVTILRDPTTRLLSMYRFLRAHDPNYARARNLDLILLANVYTAEAFFMHSSVRASPWFNNGLVNALAGTIGFGRWERAQKAAGPTETVRYDKLLDLAKARIGLCTAVGLFEAFEQSVQLIASQLGFPIPGSLKREMAFEDIAGNHPHIRMVDQVELTQSVAQSIEPLIALDQKLYTFAAEEFTKSLGILRSISVRADNR